MSAFTLSATSCVTAAMTRMSLKSSTSKTSTSAASTSLSAKKTVGNASVFALNKRVTPSASNGRGALVITAGGRSIGCTLGGTRRKTARKSGFFARKATPNGRRVLKARMKKGRKVLAPAGKTHSTWNRMKK
ncbi:unnamed protein product [Bathycoccus prasinos]|jgi:large subunit ribosomal protein L34|mmetsp:Transcript_2196/g.7853  ORF Transcript_2196/g.7853 Transcript_2196/m.7853 type:complete len:132 (+) Transcript_2196:112-507(+)